MELDIPQDEYERIRETIADEKSPVGIDARHTHILILHKLIGLERRLARLERRLERDAED